MPTVWEQANRDYEAKLAAAIAGLTDEWGVRAHRQHGTSDGVAFVGKLTRFGKTVGSYENSGQGGPNQFWFDKPADREAFYAEADRLLPTIAFEREDHLLSAILERAGK